MNTASISSISLGGKPSILNLFAYIRDLYQNSDPQTFDASLHHSWSLQDWFSYAQANNDAFKLDLRESQANFLQINHQEVAELITPDALKEWVIILEGAAGTAPILQHRTERIEKFESSEERETAFNKFEEEVQGQALHRIANKEIPALLRDWIDVEVKEDKVFINRKDKKILFEADDLRVQMYQAYARVFRQYFEENWYLNQTNSLYQELHQTYFELKAQPQKQLFFSFGLIYGKIGEKTYSDYLYHIPLSLKLVQQSLHIEAHFDEKAVNCKASFTSWLDELFEGESPNIISGRKKDVLAKVDQFNTQRRKFSFDANAIEQDFYKPALDLISIFPQVQDHFFTEAGDELNINFDCHQIKEGLSFSFSPVIQLRSSNDQFLISKDATAILKKIDRLIEEGHTDLIPDFFNKLFNVPAPRAPKLNSRSTNEGSKEKKKASFLFPLPYNKEQLAIAQRLEQQDAVTVMGPPGTGKSHTIANITSHYVAQGKSVLIVSKNAKALEVIKHKLPGPIQDLAISLLGEGNFDDTVKHTIDNIKERLSRNYNWDDILRIENELEETEKASKRLIHEISNRIGENDEQKSYFNPITQLEETRSIAEWAAFIQDLKLPILFIKDPINHKQGTDGLPAILSQYVELTAGLSPESHQLTNFTYPESELWISPEEFQHICDRLDALSSIIEVDAYHGHEPGVFTEELENALEDVENDLHILDEAGRISRNPLFKQHILRDLFDRNETHFQLLGNPVLDHEVELAGLADTEPEILLKEIHQLMEKFANHQQLGIIKRKTLSPQAKKFFNCKVDNIQVRNLNQLSILEAYISRAYSMKRLKIVLGNYFESLGIAFDPKQLSSTLKLLKEILDALANLEELNRLLKKKGLRQLNHASKEVRTHLDFLKNIKFFKIYQEESSKVNNSISLLKQNIKGNSHPVVAQLHEALLQLDADAYRRLYEEYLKSTVLVEKVRESEQFYQDLKKALPLTADHLRGRIHEEMAQMEIPMDSIRQQMASECFILKLTDFLDSVSETIGEIPRLFEELHQLQRLKEQWVSKLVALQTWQFKSQSITDKERSALTAWRNDLINIGKGHGKNTERNMRSAIHNMQMAKEAVPIWIMQQDTAITFFPDPEPQQFDLLIIDEASQCDISMLNLVFRASKCMIVGDENQTSVATKASSFPIERTNQILDRYLHDHPFKQQFNINNRTASIYTMSGVIYPNIVALTEHFRCRPEIIGFSNKYVYNQQISPLKSGSLSPWGKAVEAVFVEEEEVKAKRKPNTIGAIIDRIEQYIDLYEGGETPKLPTIGILCLESSNDVHQESLIRSLSRNPRIRKYRDAMKLLVGTSRKFQGDERDVILLSCTASYSIGKNGKTRSPRAVMGEEMQRIYNVAASRAKEVSVLFHSLSEEAIAGINPNCIRRKLIDYYTESPVPREIQQELESLLSETKSVPGGFKHQVCEFLFGAGLGGKMIPQYEIGNIVLDFALLSKTGKAAILCDGEGSSMYAQELIDQQLLLERVGWKVYRISRLQWHQKGEAIKAALISWLEKHQVIFAD